MDKSGTSLIARALRGEKSSGKPSLARGFRLGPWLVRPDLCTLESDGRRVQLEPKTMGALLCLAGHAPDVVTRDQFIEEVWSGRTVSDEVLSRAISLLRSELGDDSHEPRYIRTIPRVGYSLIAPVERAKPGADQVPVSSRRPALAAAALGAVAVLAIAGWWLKRDHSEAPAGPVRLAVLPLASIEGSGEETLADALTDELTVSLARVRGLRVVARNSALRFRSDQADLAAVAEALHATHVMTGSVRESGGRLRVSVHLADSASGSELWAETYDRGFDDLFGVQADISMAVTRALRRQLPKGGHAPLVAEAPPANPEAYRLYLQGRQQMARRGEEGLRQAKALLERSVAADPAFLRAHMALAWACTLLANAVPQESAASAACADRALAALARETAMSGEVQAVRAWLEVERNRWIDAEEAFRIGLAANPDDTEMRLQRSHMLGALGALAAAQDEANLALANDPLSPIAMLRQAVLALWQNQDQEAAALLAKAREFDLAPSASPELPMLLFARGGEIDALEQALRELQRRRGLSDDWVPATIAALRDPAKGAAAEAALERAAAAKQIDGLLFYGALVLSQRYDRALRWLLGRPRVRAQELEFTMLSREAAGLRRLPDFHRVVTRFGLDDYWDRYGWPAQCGRSAGVIACH